MSRLPNSNIEMTRLGISVTSSFISRVFLPRLHFYSIIKSFLPRERDKKETFNLTRFCFSLVPWSNENQNLIRSGTEENFHLDFKK